MIIINTIIAFKHSLDQVVYLLKTVDNFYKHYQRGNLIIRIVLFYFLLHSGFVSSVLILQYSFLVFFKYFKSLSSFVLWLILISVNIFVNLVSESSWRYPIFSRPRRLYNSVFSPLLTFTMSSFIYPVFFLSLVFDGFAPNLVHSFNWRPRSKVRPVWGHLGFKT